MADSRSLAVRLAEYVAPGTSSGATAQDSAFLGECLAEATALVAAAIGAVQTVPTAASERATLEVASELFHRRAAPNGITQFATTEGSPIRVARDPMVAARPILAPYLPLGFA